MNFIDNFLNKITMYRLVLYFLIILLGIGVVLGAFGILPFSPLSIIFSSTLFVAVCFLTNTIFSKVFNAPTNVESVYITALILALIIAPGTSFNSYLFIVMAGVLSMASKYILAINKKHLFNPAAIAVSITALLAGSSANWWVGTSTMLPLVLIGGLLIARKIRREDMVFTFLVISFVTIAAFGIIKGSDVFSLIKTVAFDSPIFFFAFIMFTEPLTLPPTKELQIYFAVLVGFLFSSNIHIGNIYSTPELALVAGNIFSFLVSPKEKLILKLKERIQTSPDTFDFIFPLTNKIAYQPGQYMEWTLPHEKADSRGNRRYFTLASSPTENSIRIGVKFNIPSSSFKKALLKEMNTIVATQRAGEFTLPSDPKEKLVFMAGGIGITPFRSILKYLIDKNEKRDIILLFSNKRAEEIVYQDIFKEAQEKLNIKVIFTITDNSNPPLNWTGKIGRIDQNMIKSEVQDFQERKFYLSGPHGMVEAYKNTLKEMGVLSKNIKEDYFPGFV
jgi:glycine betaine catabolism B